MPHHAQIARHSVTYILYKVFYRPLNPEFSLELCLSIVYLYSCDLISPPSCSDYLRLDSFREGRRVCSRPGGSYDATEFMSVYNLFHDLRVCRTWTGAMSGREDTQETPPGGSPMMNACGLSYGALSFVFRFLLVSNVFLPVISLYGKT